MTKTLEEYLQLLCDSSSNIHFVLSNKQGTSFVENIFEEQHSPQSRPPEPCEQNET